MKNKPRAVELGRLNGSLALSVTMAAMSGMFIFPSLSHAQSADPSAANAATGLSGPTTTGGVNASSGGASIPSPTTLNSQSAKQANKAVRVESHTKAANAVAKKADATGDTHGDAVIPTAADTTAAAAVPVPGGHDVNSLVDMFTKGHFSGNLRSLYFSTHNGFFSKGVNQDTIAYGGKLAFTTARFYGFSLGVSGYLQRDINRSSNPEKVDTYLGPNITAMGEAYLKWEHVIAQHPFTITVGNQELDVPFASPYDWRMAPELFQGVDARYGDADNYLTAFRMFRYKSYIDNSFNKRTNYNVGFDSYSDIGNTETNGFWGVGIGHQFKLAPVTVSTQAWYQSYLDYADLAYAEGQVIQASGSYRPFVGAQWFHETGNGRELLGNIDSQVYGLQLGVKHNSVTVSLGYDYIAPHQNSYLNGALVTPYAHNVASGPLFAQPFLTSTQDLGSGNAYAIDISGAPSANWFIGARYSFMDLKTSASAASQNQSEYLAYAIYNFQGKLKGLSLSDFLGVQTSPLAGRTFIQNRVQIEYAFGAT